MAQFMPASTLAPTLPPTLVSTLPTKMVLQHATP